MAVGAVAAMISCRSNGMGSGKKTTSRRDLIELARDGSAAHRLARRANAVVSWTKA